MQDLLTQDYIFLDDDMALNEQDRAWIRSEITTALERYSQDKLRKFIREWLGAIIAGGALLLVVGGLVSYISFRTHTEDRLDAIETKDFPRLEKRLDSIEDSIKSLSKVVSNIQLQRYASLPQKDFQASLPQLKSSIQLAKEIAAKVPLTTMTELQKKLLDTDKNVQEFWPTVSEFINYRSIDLSPENNNPFSLNVANCTDSDPYPMTVAEVGPGGSLKRLSNAHYDNCKFTLDSKKDDARLNALILKGYYTIEFRHCLIAYHGGDFTLITHASFSDLPIESTHGHGATVNYNGPTLQFVESLFEFSVPSQVPSGVQMFLTSLLEQTGPNLSLHLKADIVPSG